MYADTERGARYSEVLPGDRVLVQQERKDKLSTRFNPSPYTVVEQTWKQLDCAIPRRSSVLSKHFACEETAAEQCYAKYTGRDSG